MAGRQNRINKMRKSFKIGAIVASIYLVFSVLSFYVCPFYFGKTIDVMPVIIACFVLIVGLISIIGVEITSFIFYLLPASFTQKYCQLEPLFPVCTNSASYIVVIIINTTIFFLVGFFITSLFDKIKKN